MSKLSFGKEEPELTNEDKFNWRYTLVDVSESNVKPFRR